MGLIGRVFVLLAAAASFFPSTCVAQNQTPVAYTDPTTGIVFDTWSVPDAPPNGDSEGPATSGGLTFGVALPSDALAVDATEFIGYLKCASKNGLGTGWCGMSFGGGMTNSLLLVAWPYNSDILTSFRYATAYAMPDLYTGNATLTQISSKINATNYELIFRCQNCLSWSQDGVANKVSTSSKFWLLGWAQATPSPANAQCPNSITLLQHDNGMNLFPATLDTTAANPSYTAWAAKATKTVTGDCGASSSTSISSVPVPTGTTYDYVVVGGGAGGIPIADKLSEAGKSVLLIEKGPPSSGRWGGTMKPAWLDGTNLTRFDVPGLCNEIWVDANGIACTDTDQMAGCVLGGGTAVNAGLWWKPYTLDWDYNFPSGWQSSDMAAATSRVFSRIPGTDTPSLDGKLYLQQGFNVIASGLKTAGWTSVVPNNSPNQKISFSPFLGLASQKQR